MFVTLEVRKVPAGCHEIGPHPLNSVHEHSGTTERGCLAVLDDDARGLEPRPKPMDDISLGFIDVWPEVGETSFRPFANLETWNCGGPLYVQRDLQVIVESSEDRIRFFEFRPRGRFVGDGELVRFAGTSVFTGTEVGDVHGFPSRLLGVWIVNLHH